MGGDYGNWFEKEMDCQKRAGVTERGWKGTRYAVAKRAPNLVRVSISNHLKINSSFQNL